MRNRYRSVIAGFAALGALLAMILMPAPCQAQTPAQPYRVPRTKDGKPDLNGIWQAVNSANWDIEGHGAAPGPFWQLEAEFSVPPGLGVVEGGPIPYKPEALQKKKETSRRSAEPGSGNQMLSAWRAARHVYALPLSDHDEPSGHHDGV